MTTTYSMTTHRSNLAANANYPLLRHRMMMNIELIAGVRLGAIDSAVAATTLRQEKIVPAPGVHDKLLSMNVSRTGMQ